MSDDSADTPKKPTRVRGLSGKFTTEVLNSHPLRTKTTRRKKTPAPKTAKPTTASRLPTDPTALAALAATKVPSRNSGKLTEEQKLVYAAKSALAPPHKKTGRSPYAKTKEFAAIRQSEAIKDRIKALETSVENPLYSEDQRKAAQMAARILLARLSFYEFCCYILEPLGQQPAKHHIAAIELLERIANGTLLRLIINMPPGFAKSTYTSVLFPAYYMLKNPRSQIIGASNSGTLALGFSKQVRNLVAQHKNMLGFDIDPDNASAERWGTTSNNGAVYRAVGAGSAILGVRANLVLIDDPYASRAEAQSPAERRRIAMWYKSDVISRLSPAGRVVLIMTRFHQDDLAGSILAEDHKGRWKVLKIPYYAEANDPLGRQIDEPLWPEYYSVEEIEDKRRDCGPLEWAANYQQHPVPADGGLFDAKRLLTLDKFPTDAKGEPIAIKASVRSWDIAATLGGGDHTVGVLMHRMSDDNYIIEDVIRIQGNPEMVHQHILLTAEEDGKSTLIRLPIDPGAAGISQNQYLTRMLAGYRVISERETGSKETRAGPLATQVNAGNVRLITARWNNTFLDEFEMFPSGKYDDQVDASANAFLTVYNAKRASTRHVMLKWSRG